MKKDKKEVKNKAIKKRYIIVPIIILSIIIIVGFVFWQKQNDKSYKLETITQFSYFKLYENEKYGVIDSMRKYFSRAKI